jgi:hypothetical protein
MTTPDPLAAIPGTPWRDPLDHSFRLTPAAGLHLGTDATGRAITLPAPGPAGTRVGVLGDALFARLVALRLLAVGARVTAATRTPEPWAGLVHAAGGRLDVTASVRVWPPRAAAPPTVDDGPQALVSTLRRPPSRATANGPWRTVVHVANAAPPRSGFWDAPDAVIVLHPRLAEAASRLLGTEAARPTASLVPGEIALFHPYGTEVLRVDITPAENALLLAPEQAHQLD